MTDPKSQVTMDSLAGKYRQPADGGSMVNLI